MLVISCIKQVPDTTQVQIDPVTNTLIRDGLPFIKLSLATLMPSKRACAAGPAAVACK